MRHTFIPILKQAAPALSCLFGSALSTCRTESSPSWAPPTQPADIVTAIAKPPITPTQTLFSRRNHVGPDGKPVEVRGDAILFPLDEKSTNPLIVQRIKTAQERIFLIVETDLNLIGKTYPSKDARHQKKSFKRHKKLHLAFSGTVPPSSLDHYLTVTGAQTEAQKHAAKTLFEKTLAVGITGNVRECKWNPDGHLVVRIDIEPAIQLAECRATVSEIFGTSYLRYGADPEKQKTLASVIGVIDPDTLSEAAKAEIKAVLSALEIELKTVGYFPLHHIEWVHYTKRTLSENARISTKIYAAAAPDVIDERRFTP